LSPASSAVRFCRSIRASTRICCRWRWWWSYSAAPAVCSAPSSAASSSVSSTISARRCCLSLLILFSFFPCCWFCCSGLLASLAGTCHEWTPFSSWRRAHSARNSALLDDRRLLRQCRQPDSFLRNLRARLERAGRLRRAGLAWPCRTVWRDRLRDRLHAAARLRSSDGDHYCTGDQPDFDGNLCRVVAAFDRHRLHHDYAGAGGDPLGSCLSLDQPHRRRQRPERQDAARTVRLFAGGR